MPSAASEGVAAGDLECQPDPAVAVDAGRCIVAVNVAAEHLTGFRAAELVGRPCAEVLDVRDGGGAPVWAGGWDPGSRLRSVRGVSEQNLTLRRRDGADIAVVVTGVYRRALTPPRGGRGGEVVGAVFALRPVRRRRDGPSAIEVISTVSHELRSPLTSVKGYTSLMLNRWDRLGDDDKRMMLEQVHHDADRVVRLITELLDISRLETGRLVLRRQLVPLADLARRVVAKVALEYPDLVADVNVAPAVGEVFADPDKVEQVLTNLVENACKYASPEGLRITATVDRAGTVNVVVADRGEGIPSVDLPRVFTKFFRRFEGRPTGSGLGLWISRGLVEAHDGVLTASSVPGEGTSFRFTIPATASGPVVRPDPTRPDPTRQDQGARLP